MANINFTLKQFALSAIIEQTKVSAISNWRPQTAYYTSDTVVSDDKVYVATNNGISSSTALGAPSHNSGQATDNQVNWLFLRRNDAGISSWNNFYLGVGKSTAWENDSSPPAPILTEDEERNTLEDLLFLVKLTSQNTRLVIPRNSWVSGTVFSKYTNGKQDAYAFQSYATVVDSGQLRVYRCIDNNGGNPSTVSPSGTGVSVIRTADNYSWFYLCSIDQSELNQFGSSQYIPVSTKIYNDLSDQWIIQQNAKNGQVSYIEDTVDSGGTFPASSALTVSILGVGANAGVTARTALGNFIDFYVNAFGQDYDDNTFVVCKETSAVGSGASISATISAGMVDSITVSSAGAGYTGGAKVLIVGDGSGATAEPVIAGGSIVSVNMTNNGTGYTYAKAFIVPGSVGAAARLRLGPRGGHGKDVVKELAARTLAVSCKITDALKPYVVNSSFRQIALVANAAMDTNNFSVAMGPAHPDILSTSLNKYHKGSGNVVYLNNITPITHSENQEEQITIYLSI